MSNRLHFDNPESEPYFRELADLTRRAMDITGTGMFWEAWVRRMDLPRLWTRWSPAECQRAIIGLRHVLANPLAPLMREYSNRKGRTE